MFVQQRLFFPKEMTGHIGRITLCCSEPSSEHKICIIYEYEYNWRIIIKEYWNITFKQLGNILLNVCYIYSLFYCGKKESAFLKWFLRNVPHRLYISLTKTVSVNKPKHLSLL